MARPRTTRDLLEAKHGVRFTSVDTRAPATLGVSAVQVFKQDPARIGFLFINLSLNNMFLRPRVAPTSASGIRVDPNGGSVSLNWEDDGEMVGWEWFGLADGAASPIFGLETLITPEV